MAADEQSIFRMDSEGKISSVHPVDISSMSETELNAELEKGYADMLAGRTRPAGDVFADIRKL